MATDLRRRAFRFVLLFGVVSLLADVVYEGAHSVNGQFLQSLGASATAVGAVAGLGELAAYGLRFVSGRVADRTKRHWPLSIAGYVVNLLAVPSVALVGNWPAAAALMVLERIGKAIRKPATEAMLSHAAHAVGPGLAFGIHEAMDEAGAALGPVAVAGVLWWRNGAFQLAYALLLVPALLSLATLALARWSFPHPGELEPANPHAAARGFTAVYWALCASAALIAIGFADFSLIAYHLGKEHVLAVALVPLLYGLANGVNAGTALVAGRAFDAWGPKVLAVGILVPALSTPLVFSSQPALAVAGTIVWGLGVAVQQTLFRAMVTRMSHRGRRASAFGTFDGIWGVASLAGGLLLGALYDVGVAWLVAVSVAAQLAAAPFAWWVAAKAPRRAA